MVQKSFQKSNFKANKKAKEPRFFFQIFVKALIFSARVTEFCKRAPQKSYFLRKEYVGSIRASSISRFFAVNKRPLVDFKGQRGGFFEILVQE